MIDYRPHQALAAPALPRNEIWRTILGLISITALFMGLFAAAIVVANMIFGQDATASRLQSAFTIGFSTLDTMLVLYSFVLLALATALVVILLHRRSPLGMIGPLAPALNDFWRALRVLPLIYILMLIFLPLETQIFPNLSTRQWIALLPLSLLALLIQTGTEELIFRGYLQQQLAARFRHPLIWIGLPAILFGLVHYDPQSNGGNAWLVVIWATLFGLCAADLTARTGNLGAAVALHFANNFIAILIVSLAGPLSGLALYTVPYDGAAPQLRSMFVVDIGYMLVSWLAIRVSLRV